MFVARKQELSKLDEFYHLEKFQCVVIYGRRRVGKTALMNEFIKDKSAIFFTGLETSGDENLKNLSRAIFDFSNPELGAPVYFDFETALDAIFKLAKEERIIFVIDEYPYLENSHKGFSSILQKLIDKHKETSKLFLILCGSSMSFMENQVMGEKSPLYGRRTGQMKILPFSFNETREYFKKFNLSELLTIYGVTGGVPHYLAQINENISVSENIIRNFFDTSSFMFEEPSNLLKQELREPALYNAIIRVIAEGSSKSSEIASKAGISTGVLSTYSAHLISLGIVKKETPVIGDSVKKTIYSIDDKMFRFWYRFVPQNISAINAGMGETVFRNIEGQIPAFLGRVFEDVCKQHLWELNKLGKTPIFFTKIGRWWGNDPIKKEQSEIDIIACKDKESAIFAECKWTEAEVGEGVLNKLIERSRIFDYANRYYYIFAKNGFDESIKKRANEFVSLLSLSQFSTPS